MAFFGNAETAQLNAVLNLQDHTGTGVSSALRNLNRLKLGASQTALGAAQVGAGLARIGVIGATAVVTGVTAAIKVAGDFQAQLNTINTIAKASPAALNSIGDGIRKLAREGGGELNDLTKGYYDLLSAGISVKDAQGVLNQAFTLGRATLGTTAQSVDILTTAINAYRLNAAQARKVSDELAQAVQDGKVTLDQIAPVYAEIAPLAAQTGVGTDQIAAAFGRLTAQGVPAAEVATEMNRALLELVKPQGALSKLQQKMGVNFADEVRKRGLVPTLQEIRNFVHDDKTFVTLFGRIEGLRFALQTTGPSFRAFEAELARVRHSAGLTEKQFAERQQGLNFQIARLRANLQSAGITIGNAFLPKIVPLVQLLTDFLGKNQDKIAKLGTDLAKGFGSFVDRVKAGDFNDFVTAMKLVAGASKTIVDAFLKLPASVQAIVVGGLAINRLSGGLIGAGVGNIAGGLVKLVFERGASPANPLWVASVGGGVGGPGAPVTGGGGIGSTIARWVLGPAAAAIIGAEIAKAINAPTVGPARSFEANAFKQAIESTDIGSLQHDLAAIEGQFPTISDPLKSVAFGASYLPFIGDAIGNLGPELDSQAARLRERIRLLQIAQHNDNLRTAPSIERAAVLEAASYRTTTRLLANSIAARQISSRDQAITRDRIAGAVSRLHPSLRHLEALGSATATYTGIVSRKKFDPTINLDIAANFTYSASSIASSVRRRLSITNLGSVANRGLVFG